MNIDKAMIEEDLNLLLCEYPMNNLHIWTQDGWEIRICPSYNENVQFYFKLYNDSCIEKATKQARISILEPEYIIPPISYKERWILNNDEKEKLIKILQTNMDIQGMQYTVYEYIKFSYKEQRYGMHSLNVPENFMKLPMPDYTKLKEE